MNTKTDFWIWIRFIFKVAIAASWIFPPWRTSYKARFTTRIQITPDPYTPSTNTHTHYLSYYHIILWYTHITYHTSTPPPALLHHIPYIHTTSHTPTLATWYVYYLLYSHTTSHKPTPTSIHPHCLIYTFTIQSIFTPPTIHWHHHSPKTPTNYHRLTSGNSVPSVYPTQENKDGLMDQYNWPLAPVSVICPLTYDIWHAVKRHEEVRRGKRVSVNPSDREKWCWLSKLNECKLRL